MNLDSHENSTSNRVTGKCSRPTGSCNVLWKPVTKTSYTRVERLVDGQRDNT